MKHECEIIRDLMPLCVDETASEKTRRAVDEHVSQCSPCGTVYSEMKAAVEVTAAPPREDAQFDQAVRRIRKRRTRRRWGWMLLGVLLSAVLVLAGLGGYYWYFEDAVEITPKDFGFRRTPDGVLMVNVQGIPGSARLVIDVTGKDLDADGSMDYEAYMHVTATRAQLRRDDLGDFYFIFGNYRDVGMYMLHDGGMGVKLAQVIHGTPDMGGKVIYVDGRGIPEMAMFGLTLRVPEIVWHGTMRTSACVPVLLESSQDGMVTISPTPLPRQTEEAAMPQQ